MTSRARVSVIGGSLGGLFAAVALYRRGFDVHVYERSATPLASRGAGIVTHERMRAALRAIGLSVGDDLGIAVAGRRTYARDGTLVAEIAFPQVNTAWDRLLDLLRSALPNERYHLGASLVSFTDTDDRITAHFADGRAITADLLIGADGIRSAVRSHVMPQVQPLYAGYVAWRGLVEERMLSPAAHDALMHHFTFGLPPGEQVLAYPVAGANNAVTRGQLRCNLVWYRPADPEAALPNLLTDAAGKPHDGGIPPPLIRADVLGEMRRDAEHLLAPAFAEVMRQSPMPILQPIYDLETPTLVFGRAVLIGDAAFVARPHVGAGVTKAMEDGLALADALTETGDRRAALSRFDRLRLSVGRRIVAEARLLGAAIGAHGTSAVVTPETTMEKTASLAFLD
jgi:2-polyprenyl-6-methoxyphenol hydroxylase-like FAD-dependent oxidoreductase